MKPKRKADPLSTETTAALDGLAVKLAALPAARRAAFEREVLRLDSRAANPARKRGRPPKHGAALSVAVILRLTPAMRRDMQRAAKRAGFDAAPDYLRWLHERFRTAEGIVDAKRDEP